MAAVFEHYNCLREKGDAEVLGVYALEDLSLEIDPQNKRIKEIRSLAIYT